MSNRIFNLCKSFRKKNGNFVNKIKAFVENYKLKPFKNK